MDALDVRPFGIDWIDCAPEWAVEQVAHQDIADTARRDAGANHRDRAWMKERVERMTYVSHGNSFGKRRGWKRNSISRFSSWDMNSG
jgi:hypothetical protein